MKDSIDSMICRSGTHPDGWWARLRQANSLGQSMVLFAMMLPVLAGITGLAIDAGVLYYQRRNIQSIADAAALTGAQVSNFNPDAPEILKPAGPDQARANAYYNGAIPGEVDVHVPPQLPLYQGKLDYIEVHVVRGVNNAFMGVFGQGTSVIGARAVARCVKPGYGDPAILALSFNPDAVTLNGAGGDLGVIGDIVSYGGIDANGNAENFDITGGAYSMTQPATTNLTTTDGTFGTDSGVDLLAIPDPILRAMYAGTLVWPNIGGTYPYSTNGTYPPTNTGAAWTCKGNYPPSLSTGTKCVTSDPNSGNVRKETGNVIIQSNEWAIFTPGNYGDVKVYGDYVIFQSGVYAFRTIQFLGSDPNKTYDQIVSVTEVKSEDPGVLFMVWGTNPNGPAFSAKGAKGFNIHYLEPNTWMNCVLVVPNDDIDLGGSGDRKITGCVYAPKGNVNVRGNGSGAVITGQLIANTVVISGVGTVVDYGINNNAPTFGPVLVNVPE